MIGLSDDLSDHRIVNSNRDAGSSTELNYKTQTLDKTRILKSLTTGRRTGPLVYRCKNLIYLLLTSDVSGGLMVGFSSSSSSSSSFNCQHSSRTFENHFFG